MILTEGDMLMVSLDGLLEEDVYYKVRDFIQALEEKVDELEHEVRDLEGEVRDLEESLREAPDPEDTMEEGYTYLKFPSWMEPANTNRVGELEELIQKVGVEESVALLSQPYHAY